MCSVYSIVVLITLLGSLMIVSAVPLKDDQTTRSPSTGNAFVNETLAMLDLGNQIIQLDGERKDLTLLVGLTGSGKSTMAQLLSGENGTLEAYEVGYAILIKDSSKKISRGNETLESKTLFPELVVDQETGEAMYDCPGFKDTRNTSIEISNGFFIKKLVEHAQSIKILVVAKHSAFEVGGHRDWLRSLVTQLLKFMRNVRKYKGGIALLLTKVETIYSEERIIGQIVSFIEDNRSQIVKSVAGREEDAEALLDSWLEKNSQGKYVNIAFFRQPSTVGRLSEMADVNANRRKIREMVFYNPKFKHQPCNASDFGIPLSGEAESKIKEIQIKTNEDATNSVISLSSTLREQLERFDAASVLTPEHFKSIVEAGEQVGHVCEARDVLQLLVDMARPLDQANLTVTAEALNSSLKSLENLDYLQNNREANTTAEFCKQLVGIIKEVAQSAEQMVRSRISVIVDKAFASSRDATERIMETLDTDRQAGALDTVAEAIDSCTLKALSFGECINRTLELNQGLQFGLAANQLEKVATLENLLPAGGGVWAEHEQHAGFLRNLVRNLEQVGVYAGNAAGMKELFPQVDQACT